MQSFKIVKATQNQMSEVAKVFKVSRMRALPYLPELHSPEEDIIYFTNVVYPENSVYIAMDAGNKRALGFIAFNIEWVNHLYLLPEAQRHGIGSRLLALAKDGAQSLSLWTFQRNASAQHFYEKNGFCFVKKTDGSENEEWEPDVLLRWKK